LTVNEVNDPPTANDDDDTDGAFVDEDAWVTIDVLANDVDGDPIPDPLTVQSVTDPPNGTVVNNGGDVTYTPDADFNGTDTFQYTVSDGRGGTDTAIVTVRVDPIDDPPVAFDDAYYTGENVAINIPAPGVLGNDQEYDGESLTATQTSGDPINRNFTFNADGSFFFEPRINWSGLAEFTYEACDPGGACDSATVRIAVNDPPDASPDLYSTDEDIPLVVGPPPPPADSVLGNDSDPNSDPLTASEVTPPPNGALTLNADGSFTYSPNSDYFGPDSFEYEACDPGIPPIQAPLCDTTTVSLTVNSVNDPPVANDDPTAPTVYVVNENDPVGLFVPAPGILGNDTDVENDPLNVDLGSIVGPSNGTLTPNLDGSFSYIPDPGFSGDDPFSYRAFDGLDASILPGTVIIHVNTSPIAENDSYVIGEDNVLNVVFPGILGNDSDPDNVLAELTVSLLTDVQNGNLNLSSNGAFTYTPNPDYFSPVGSPDYFIYEVCDPGGLCDTATANIRVEPVDDQPSAQPDSATTDEDAPITIDVLSNDPMGNNPLPAPGDGIGSVAVMSGPANGITVVNGDYTITYTPDPNYFSPILPPVDPDTFTYQVCDVDGPPDCDTATVAVTVNEVNDPPTANDDDDTDGAFVNEDEWVTIDVLANDVDGDPLPIIDILSVQSVTDPPNGTVVNNGGDVTYTPDADFNGIDTFQYTVSDGRGGTDTATVTVRVDPVNDVPTAANDSVTTNEDVPVTINVLANDPMGNNPPPAPGDGFGSLTVCIGLGLTASFMNYVMRTYLRIAIKRQFP
jgi:hypothetical protein